MMAKDISFITMKSVDSHVEVEYMRAIIGSLQMT